MGRKVSYMKEKRVTLKQAIDLCEKSKTKLEIDFTHEGETTVTVGYEGWRYYCRVVSS